MLKGMIFFGNLFYLYIHFYLYVYIMSHNVTIFFHGDRKESLKATASGDCKNCLGKRL